MSQICHARFSLIWSSMAVPIVVPPIQNPEFGCTDGEGCEREWNLLNGVIPTCHISGFYRRLFVINTKQAYINGQNLCKLASHQKWHFDDTVAKLNEAEGALDRLGIPIDEIQTAWAEQLSTQQAEPPHVQLSPEKDAGMKTIKSILNLLQTYQLRSSLERVESQLAKKEYNLLLHDHKARVHEAKVDKKRQPAVIRCLDQLNKEIECMLDAWDDAPRGAIRPEKLDRKGLFSLNVDGAIWKGLHILEAGLGDNRAPPRWLADENMQVAIIAYLDWKGCHAELDIIKREVANMHVWYAEEHDAIQTAIHEAGTDSALHFHLLHKFTDLNNLGELWDHSLSRLPYPSNLRSIMPFASNSIHADVTRVHALSTPFPKGLTHELDSDSEDCIKQCEILAVTSKVLRKIDDDEECSQRDICSDDSVNTYESK
ncbi:hypothetical protein BS47DRAFT_1467798 [Hydnum rufescens UP504]|uniref:Uncharacterized protein n=1 Tax=Hydnum rufescens UP504 TaxID=1448309 RepID=A0A9P6DS74_9AGAM|nr:hypothetical protein BS47DRAFT_1467798 [Hydnum rufescens UP504]